MSTRIPLVALVGRPNVGKSTLFNRLIGRRTALVYDQPGVTRDRIFGEAQVEQQIMRVVDTGGFELETDDPLFQGVRAQTQLAIDEADFVLLVVDAMAGLTPTDIDVAKHLRRAGKPVAVVVNKIDAASREVHISEFYNLGHGDVIGLSAEHGRGLDALHALLLEKLDLPLARDTDESQQPIPVSEDEPEEGIKSQVEWKGGSIRVAVIGRPNAGKSSLVNCLLGEERHLALDAPGTTCDAIDSAMTHEGQDYIFIDTAGIRRKRSIAGRVEQFAVVASFDSMDRADVTLLVLDGTVAPTVQDARIAAMAHDKGKGLILVINKWDLVENTEWRELYIQALRKQLPFAAYAPIIRLSAKTGGGTKKLFPQIIAAQMERHRRVGTGELNRFFRDIVKNHPPPIRGGRRPQLYFVSQPLVRPPTFVFAASRTKDLHFSYIRYLQNALRERYGFDGTPIWLKFRNRSDKAAE